MTFNSYIFILLFLPLALLGYFGINKTKNDKAGLLFLSAMSLWFYGTFSIAYLLLFLFSVGINQFCVKKMEKVGKGKGRKAVFFAAIAFDLGLLFYFKYYDFFMENINHIFKSNIPLLGIALPVGISFYTFRQLSYVIDCYRNEAKPYSLLEYASYALFFPMMVQGPIARHEEVVAQFRDKDKKQVSYENLSKGIYAFSKGLAKKVLLADQFSHIVALGSANLYAQNSTDLIIVIVCYTFQIYFDFSGYCDMAYGIGWMFNIELPINFNSPYKAVSVSDFWDRWHITLTKFFTKYVYIPLGGSRRGIIRTCINTMIVFLLSGLWHGANWTFILWGAINGAFLVFERFTGKVLKKVPTVIRTAVTFCITTVLWSIFSSPDMNYAKVLWQRILAGDFGRVSENLTGYMNELTEIRFLYRMGIQGIVERYPVIPLLFFMLLAFLLVWFCKNTKEKTEQLCFEESKKYYPKMFGTVLLLTWSIISLSKVSEFIYFQF